MADVFDSVYGQPLVRQYLRACIANHQVGQGYLFTGLAGSNKTQAAYAFAQAILCEKDGCGQCDDCVRVMRRKHPDVHFLSPGGASGYLIEQIRQVVAEIGLAPIRAKKKVYIFDRADLLGTYAANAFLKTLEEPPDDVVIILLGRTAESILPTIVSRCQVVPFRHIPASEAAGIVVQNTGVSEQRAVYAIEACGGSISEAVSFVKDTERLAFRTRVLAIMGSLADADDMQVLKCASELVLKAKAPLDAVRVAQQAELEANADFLANSAIRRIEAQNKNALARKASLYLRQTTSIISSWLRDVLMVFSGTADRIINVDVTDSVAAAAARTDISRVSRALREVEDCDRAIAYNVSPETCIDVLLLNIREVLYDTSSAY